MLNRDYIVKFVYILIGIIGEMLLYASSLFALVFLAVNYKNV